MQKKPVVKSKKRKLSELTYIGLIIFLLGIIVFSNSLNNEMTFDDLPFVANNSNIQSFDFVSLWTKDFGNIDANVGLYRPVVSSIYALLYSISPTDSSLKDKKAPIPFIFRLFNILLHSLNSFLIFMLLRKIGLNIDIASIISIVFLVTPIHTEAVVCISRLSDLLALTFTLTSILAFEKKAYIWVIISFGLGLLTKESAILNIFILIMFSFLFKTSGESIIVRLKDIFKNWILFTILILIFIIYLMIRIAILGNIFNSEDLIWHFLENPMILLSFSDKIITGFYLFIKYIYQMIVPISLSHDYSFSSIIMEWNLSDPLIIISIIIFVGLIYTGIKYYKKYPFVTFFVFFFLITYFVISNWIFVIGSIYAERLIYMPSLGFYCIIIYSIYTLFSRFKSKAFINTFYVLSLIVIIGYSAMSSSRNLDYKNTATLCERDLISEPSCSRMYYNLAVEKSTKDKQYALELAYKSIQINPLFFKPYVSISKTYLDANNSTKAIECLAKIVQIDRELNYMTQRPSELEYIRDAYKNVIIYFFNNGLYDQAENLSKEAIFRLENSKVKPGDVRTVYAITIIAKYNDKKRAFDEIALGLSEKPKQFEGHFQIAKMYEENNLIDKAIDHYYYAFQIERNNTESINKILYLLEKQGKFAELEEFKRQLGMPK